MANVSVEDLERAVVRLGRSEKGQRAMSDLLALLENGGISLDEKTNCTFSACWREHGETTRGRRSKRCAR